MRIPAGAIAGARLNDDSEWRPTGPTGRAAVRGGAPGKDKAYSRPRRAGSTLRFASEPVALCTEWYQVVANKQLRL